MSRVMSEEERKTVGKKLAEARAKKRALATPKQTGITRILEPRELSKAMKESGLELEDAIVKFFNSHEANFQTLEEVTYLSYLEIREILSKAGWKFKDGYQ